MHMIAEKIKARRTALIVIFAIAVVFSVFIVIEYKDSDYYRFDPDSFILTNAAIEENRIVVSDDIPEDSEVVNTDAFWLTPGAYSVDITYSASGTSLIRLTVDNDQFREYTLDPGGSVLNISFSTTHPTNRAKIQIFAGPESGLVIEDMIMYADHRIYTDAVYHAILLVLALLAALICVIKMPAIRSAKDIPDAFYIIIAIALSTCMFYLVDKGGQIFCIDTRGQMQRIEGVALGLRDRQFPVIIAPNFFNEFGQLEFMYPNLFLYPFGILRLFGVSMSEAYRSYMLLINTLTAVCTYYAGKSMFPKRITYLSVAALYLFMPHRMDVMLDLGAAAGTGIAVAFLPLLISGFYLLLKADRRCIRSLVFGMSGILNSHVVTLILVTGFLSFLFLINIKRLVSDRCSRLLLLCRAAVTTVILNLGFLVVFLGCYMSEWDKKRIQWSDYEGMTLDMTTVPEATYIWLYMLAVVIAAVIWIMMRKKIPDTDRKYMADLLVVCILAFVAASNLIPWTALFSKSDFIRNVF
ncbi:MAG: hypothetical protein IKQ40_01955, partial [Lachnospiraceae bacterium]|nr:hypothetical protein [Lachnospiraceae bacterium]